jgi:hypothetical protein
MATTKYVGSVNLFVEDTFETKDSDVLIIKAHASLEVKTGRIKTKVQIPPSANDCTGDRARALDQISNKVLSEVREYAKQYHKENFEEYSNQLQLELEK